MRVGGIRHHYLEVGPYGVPLQVFERLVVQVVVCNKHEFNKLTKLESKLTVNRPSGWQPRPADLPTQDSYEAKYQ